MREPLPEWPMFGMADDVRPALAQAQQGNLPIALATLTSVEGGGPRPPGTQMVFAHGIVSGYFSGGCVESDVADHAFACLEDGTPRRLVYGAGSPWPDIQLLCGARIEIFVDQEFRSLYRLRAKFEPAELAIPFAIYKSFPEDGTRRTTSWLS